MIYLKLFAIFCKIGFFGFGGGLAMLPMIYQGVQTFGIMTPDQFSNLVAISQVTPGPMAVNAATYVGYLTAGIPGAIAATLGVSVPSFILVMLACYFIKKFKESQAIEGAFYGIRPATVGLLGAAVVFIGETTLISIPLSGISTFSNLLNTINVLPCVIFAVTIILVGKFKINPIIVILVMGVVGAFLCG